MHIIPEEYKDDPDTITVLDEHGNQFTMLVSDVERDNLSSPYLKKISKSYWISSYYYDVLKSQDKNILFDKEKGWIKSWSTSTGEDLSEAILPTLLYLTENLVYIFSYSAFGIEFLIESDSESEQSILLNCYLHPDPLNDRYKFWDEDDFIRKINNKEHVSLRLTFDGDYMKLYEGSSNELLETFARIRKDDYKIVTNKLRQIVGDKRVLMDDITFPRHADGSCDYDDIALAAANETTDIEESENTHATKRAESVEEAAFPESAVSKPAPAMGKTATVTENLRMRSDYDTTAEVVATLAAGTRVKVHLPGKEDTIDGIASNWVWVETLVGAKDKDGNTVAAGTKGWLFGGYLSEAEDAKQNAALPILPIAAGVAALAVLLAVVLLAAKRRKVNIMTDVYKLIADMICNSIDDKWEKAVVEIESSPWQMLSTSAYYFKDGHKNAFGLIDDNQDEDLGENIFELQESMQSKNKWNRAVYTLERNGHFDMEFIWDQALQDEWDKA